MGGIIKGILKPFKEVGDFVKDHWKAILTVVVVAVAIYFTAGLAMGAMPEATTAFAGVGAGVDVPLSAATYAGMATDIAASGTAAGALGITDFAAASAGAGDASLAGAAVADSAVGIPGIDSALAAGSDLSAGAGDAAVATGAADATSSAVPGAVDYGGAATTDTAADTGFNATTAGTGAAGADTGGSSIASTIGSGISKAGTAVKGFWGGMSTGEKLMFASTAFSAISGALKQPTRASEGLWPGGAYFGMDSNGTDGAGGPPTDLAGTYKNALTGQDTSAAAQAGAPTAATGNVAPTVGNNPNNRPAAAPAANNGVASTVGTSSEFLPSSDTTGNQVASSYAQNSANQSQQQQMQAQQAAGANTEFLSGLNARTA